MSFFDMISNAVKSYGASVIIRENELTVTNCQNGKTITIFADTFYDKEGSAQFSEYIVEFSTQHCHFEDDEEEEIIDYIQSIMRDEVLPIEFFCTGQRCFGGELDRKKNTGADPTKWLSDNGIDPAQYAAFAYEINSWSGRFDSGRQNLSK